MIKQAVIEDVQTAALLALQLWPNHTLEEFSEEMAQLIHAENATIYLAYEDDEEKF